MLGDSNMTGMSFTDIKKSEEVCADLWMWEESCLCYLCWRKRLRRVSSPFYSWKKPENGSAPTIFNWERTIPRNVLTLTNLNRKKGFPKGKSWRKWNFFRWEVTKLKLVSKQIKESAAKKWVVSCTISKINFWVFVFILFFMFGLLIYFEPQEYIRQLRERGEKVIKQPLEIVSRAQ